MLVFPRRRTPQSRHLSDHTGPLPAVARVGRHHVTSETPGHFTARQIVATSPAVQDGRYTA